MITNTGKDIIAKYMLGQAPAFASHIALGCGKKPLGPSDSLQEFQSEFAFKENLDFEMFRIPIVSRGYVTEIDPTPIIITGAVGNGTYVTYTAVNSFSPGDIVDISGVAPSAYNLQNSIIFSASPTEFVVKSNVTGAFSSTGEAFGRISKLALTAELPTEQRYEITEVGLFPARSNPSAANKDSRILYTFAETENWEYHGQTSSIGIGSSIATPLYEGAGPGIINPNLGIAPAFRSTSNNAIFDSDERLSNNERPRFLNSAILVPGNLSTLQMNSGELSYVDSVALGTHGNHIHLAGTSVSLSQNSPDDELRLAFSVIKKDETFELTPSKVYVLVEFSPEEASASSTSSAKFQVALDANTDDYSGNNIAESSYHIVSNKLSELVKGTGFSWGAVKLIRIYASVFNQVPITHKQVSANVATITTSKPHGFASGDVATITGVGAPFDGVFKITSVPTDSTFTYTVSSVNIGQTAATGNAEGASSNYFVALDAIKLENISSVNPLYGLTGYTAVKTSDARPIVKEANTSNLVEFRFGLDVI